MGSFQQLDELVNNCKKLLQEQLANIKIGKLAELQQWLEASTEMRSLLQQSFELAKEQGASRSEIGLFKENLSDLVGLNNKLFSEAAKQRQAISDRLRRMRKGKSALGAYSLRQEGIKPRFVSSNG